MATVEQTGFLKYKDADGNTCLVLPITTKDNVDGIDEIEATIETLNEFVGGKAVSTQISDAVDNCITGLSVSGDVITYTKNNGSTGTITTQDTNTTYSPATQSDQGLMSAADKIKLDGIATGANKTVVDSELSTSSANPVQNKAVKTALNLKPGKIVSGNSFTVDSVSVTAGDGAEIFNDYDNNIATGNYSHAEGTNASATGEASHAEGRKTVASGTYSHAEGNGSKASNSYSHAEGNFTVASGDSSHSEGTWAVASGTASHAEGYRTTAFATASHAEGWSSRKLPTTVTSSSTNEEVLNIWTDTKFNAAYGQMSHTEGQNTLAVQQYAHAEGYESVAFGKTSHAEGTGTIAAIENQHVQGRYNVKDTSDDYAHIVGNGTADDDRSNAHTIDWDGNGWFAGDVYVGSTSGTDKDSGSKKLVAGPTNVEANSMLMYDGTKWVSITKVALISEIITELLNSDAVYNGEVSIE